MGKLVGIYITEQVTDWIQIRKKMKKFLKGEMRFLAQTEDE